MVIASSVILVIISTSGLEQGILQQRKRSFQKMHKVSLSSGAVTSNPWDGCV